VTEITQAAAAIEPVRFGMRRGPPGLPSAKNTGREARAPASWGWDEAVPKEEHKPRYYQRFFAM
jgi:hypothetical protein